MTKFTSHKGSWGDSYLIEQPKNTVRITCSDCVHYYDDGSCSLKPIVISEVGYNYWRYCDGFILSKESQTDRRYKYIMRTRGSVAIEHSITAENINVSSEPVEDCKKTKASTYVELDKKKDIVQLGDTVTIQKVETGVINKYKVEESPISGKLPAILQECINKRVSDVFYLGENKYRIISIKKGKR